MCMLLGMPKQLVYAFLGFYNKETISSNMILAYRKVEHVKSLLSNTKIHTGNNLSC